MPDQDMRWRLIIAALFLCGEDALAQVDLVIRDVTLISPERAEPLPHAFIGIRDGRIVEVTEMPLDGTQEIDGTGRFLIPGLIDSHVHVGQVPGMEFGQDDDYPEVAAAARAQEPRSHLYFGFTTVVDLNSPNSDAMSRWRDVDVRPDIHFCGGAPVANGFPMNTVPEPFRFDVYEYFIYDPEQAERIPDSVNPAEHTPEPIVANMAADGALCVKVHYEPGNAQVGQSLPTPTLEMVRAVVAAAHARDMPVVIHANTKEAQAFAVRTGADVITHTMGNALPLSRETLDEDVLEILRTVVTEDIGYQPTVQAVLYANLALFDERYLEDPRVAQVVPPDLLAWFSTQEGGWFREQILARNGGAIPPVPVITAMRSYDRITRYLAESGGRLLFGSDTPATGSYGNLPGLNGRLEMTRWIGAGVSEAQLLRALTIENARAFGLENEIGTIEEGKVAHLLLLRGNPLESVDAYDTIEIVFLAGRPMERVLLSAVKQPAP